MGKDKQIRSLSLVFSALADPTRIRILNLLEDREVCVCDLVEALGTSQPKISRHLAYLRNAGLVSARRDGRWMHYRAAVPSPAASAILKTLRKCCTEDQQVLCDVAALEACCEREVEPLQP